LRLSRLVLEIPFWGIWGFSGFWEYLAASDTKSDVVLLLGDPDFLQDLRNFVHSSHRFRDPHFEGIWGFGTTFEVFS